jgi:hypothetical protein
VFRISERVGMNDPERDGYGLLLAQDYVSPNTRGDRCYQLCAVYNVRPRLNIFEVESLTLQSGIINKPHLRSLSLNHVIEHANADAKLIGCGRALVFKLQGRESSETC